MADTFTEWNIAKQLGAWDAESHARIALGLHPNLSRVDVFGHNTDVDIATVPEDLWHGGGLAAVLALSADTAMEVVSADADDDGDPADTGARTVTVVGLDQTYAVVSQTVTLNGTTPVALPTDLMRVNAFFVATAGATGTNEGVITLRGAGAGTTYAVIDAGDGVAQQAWYTVPAGCSLSIVNVQLDYLSAPAANQFATSILYIKSGSGLISIPSLFAVSANAPHAATPFAGLPFGEKTDVSLRATSVSADNTALAGGFEGILYDPNAG